MEEQPETEPAAAREETCEDWSKRLGHWIADWKAGGTILDKVAENIRARGAEWDPYA